MPHVYFIQKQTHGTAAPHTFHNVDINTEILKTTNRGNDSDISVDLGLLMG